MDLRTVTAVLKIITDLERIGDHAADISSLTLAMKDLENKRDLPLIKAMTDKSQIMIEKSIQAFVASDLALARHVITLDDEVDALFSQTRGKIIARINDINLQISKTLFNLTEEKEKLNLILNNMHQGVVLLDSVGKIKAINPFALDFFSVEEDKVLEKDVINLTRKMDYTEPIKKVFEKQESAHFEVNDRNHVYYIVLISLVEQQRQGALMLIRDITPLRHLELLKKEFFANASRELKSPLTTIKGSAELIELGFVKGEDDIKDLSRRIQKEANQMATLVEDMLYLSHVENPIDSEVKKEWNVFSELVKKVLESLSMISSQKNLEITLEGPEVKLFMNRQHLYQLLRNTVENAMKYNVVGGKITISINKLGNVQVKDTGIGIAKEDQERIFERFYRVDKGRSKASGGTGLGLAIVKHIAQYYNASIHLSSGINMGRP